MPTLLGPAPVFELPVDEGDAVADCVTMMVAAACVDDEELDVDELVVLFGDVCTSPVRPVR